MLHKKKKKRKEKIVKIYTAQPAIWPGLWRAWLGRAEVRELRAFDPARRRPPYHTSEPLHGAQTSHSQKPNLIPKTPGTDSPHLLQSQHPRVAATPTLPGPDSASTTPTGLHPTRFLLSCLVLKASLFSFSASPCPHHCLLS